MAADPDDILAGDMGRFFDDPLGFVMYAFPWDTDPAIQMVELEEPWASKYGMKYGPDKWACEFLEEWGEAIKKNGFNGKDAVPVYRAAVSSGHGIGKSTITSWIILFIMSTRPHCKGVVTANTAPQLQTKTWGELGKWKKKCVAGHWFTYNNGKGNMNIYHNDNKESWRVDGQTCKEENSESFAGLHAANSTPFYIFDEASAVPDKIWEVAEGGTTDGEPFWFAFGNPTRNTGRFRECFRKFRNRWTIRHVDSRTVRITNKNLIDEWAKDYGVDSDFFKVRVRGVFPNMSIRQFIPENLVEAARGRHLRKEQYSFAPKILTCDPAWEGDDELTIGLRQGLAFEVLLVLAKNDNDIEIANRLARFEDDLKCDGVIIDKGWGTGIYSAGITMGRNWLLADFGAGSPDPGYLNMRAYMYGQAKTWLRDGGAIEDDDELCYELCAPETVPRIDGKIQLESKKDMKKRGISSGNRADALVISFAHNITKKEMEVGGSDSLISDDYDPLN